ncbi:DUF4232 domain-containing protein [Streptomyces sp. NPDC049577]|uniref:DUF4232 domain-containing protein n=1 Tax=Streptomyces sp. NPDC049577 TaxID=3155153 RepID=UPI00341D3EEE
MPASRTLTACAALVLGSAALIGCAGPSSASSGAASGTATPAAPAAPSAGTHRTDAASTARTSASSAPSAAKHRAAGLPSHAKGSSASQAGVPFCRASQLTVSATPFAHPLNHLLITARNTSGERCDLGIIGLVTFDGRIAAEAPDGIGGGPNILDPGQAQYEGVSLDRQDAPGNGSGTSTLTVRLDGGDVVKVPLKTYVHAPAVTVWRPTAADALSS